MKNLLASIRAAIAALTHLEACERDTRAGLDASDQIDLLGEEYGRRVGIALQARTLVLGHLVHVAAGVAKIQSRPAQWRPELAALARLTIAARHGLRRPDDEAKLHGMLFALEETEAAVTHTDQRDTVDEVVDAGRPAPRAPRPDAAART